MDILQTTNTLERFKPILPAPGIRSNTSKGRANEHMMKDILSKHYTLTKDNCNKKTTPDTWWAVPSYKREIGIEFKSVKGQACPVQAGGGRNTPHEKSRHYSYAPDAFDFICITFDCESENPKICIVPWSLVAITGLKSLTYNRCKYWENNFELEGLVK